MPSGSIDLDGPDPLENSATDPTLIMDRDLLQHQILPLSELAEVESVSPWEGWRWFLLAVVFVAAFGSGLAVVVGLWIGGAIG